MKNSTSLLLMLTVAALLTFPGLALAQQGSTSDQQQPSSGVKQGSDQENVQPDNSRVNKRERREGSMNADKQGQSSGDVEITRKIRRAITSDESLSTYAHNVKIITRDGMVTLKGPVRSDQDKAAIESKAVAVAGEGKVKNELDVKPAKNRSKNR